jgi:phenylacetate-CoA ligase
MFNSIFPNGVRQALLPFPASHGLRFTRSYRAAMKRQWWSQDEIRAYQNEKLQCLLRHAYDKVPYYQQVFDECGLLPADIKNPDELTKLPILTKEDVKNNFEQMLSQDFKKHGPVLNHTGGSTGKALDFYLSREMLLVEDAVVQRHWRWAGFGPNDRVVTARGQILTENLSEVAPSRRSGNILLLSSFHFSDQSLPVYAKQIVSFEPKVLRLYPSGLLILTRYFKKHALAPITSLKSIITSSETLSEAVRQEAEEFWGVPVFDWYGLMEKVAAIGQCEHGTYHIIEDYAYHELIPTAVPNHYRLVATSFHNKVMPFIRYDTKDIVVTDSANGAGQPCACGRVFRRVSWIDGRIEGIVVTRDQRMVGRLDAAFKYSPGLKLAQVIQREPGSIQVNIVREDRFDFSDLATLTRELKLRLGEEIDIKYSFVDDIPRTPTGKIRFVISEINQP